MAKLHQQLEQLFKYRCNSNEDIIPYVKKLAEAGKFDEPKKVAVFAIILDRLGKQEDEANIEASVKEAEPLAPVVDEPTPPVEETPANPEPTTSPDVPTEPEPTPPAQTAVEPTPETPAEPIVDNESVDDGTATATISELTPENITDPTPALEPVPDPPTTS